uniref:Uncharacterized protein n=1 Tax=Anguilla anguilla TaxID=7936 RepID=A0A0E9WNW6_ANGAN
MKLHLRVFLVCECAIFKLKCTSVHRVLLRISVMLTLHYRLIFNLCVIFFARTFNSLVALHLVLRPLIRFFPSEKGSLHNSQAAGLMTWTRPSLIKKGLCGCRFLF